MTFIKGSGLCEREVIHYTNRRNAKRLRVGVTLHRSVFSSLPHAFEKSPVPGFEEAFMMLLPEGGKALVEGEGLLGFDTVDTAWPMRNADMLAVPMGWHRVTALPNEDGSIPSLAYIWAYIARDPGWEKDNDHN
jgi:hypothetical protein